MFSTQTIAAIATPLGKGGIGVIRLSGPKALDISLKVSGLKKLKARHVYYCQFKDPSNQQKIDQGCLIYFKAPHSYTGEDIIEFHCHASPYILKKLLSILLENKAELASKGAFTKQAVINGKLNLNEAEAINDIIQCDNALEHQNLFSNTKGKLYKQLRVIRKKLCVIAEQLEGSIDFPEEIPAINKKNLSKILKKIVAETQNILDNQDYSRIIKDGLKCVFIGEPNVGKSSLFNALLGENRAIINQKPGTTRDYLEASIELKGIKIHLIDTAGIRQTKNEIEKEGIKKLHSLLKKADIIFYLIDSSKKKCPPSLLKKIPENKNTLLLLTKSDLKKPTPKNMPNLPQIPCSAITKTGLNELKKYLIDTIITPCEHIQTDWLCNIRQQNCFKRLNTDIKTLLKNKDHQIEDALLSIDLKNILLNLGQLTGDELTEELLDGIFSKFCVGK